MMNTEAKPRIRPGDTVSKFADACRVRFKHTPRWGWTKLKDDPDFPRPIYLDGSPHLIDREIDEYLASRPTERRSNNVTERTKNKWEKRAVNHINSNGATPSTQVFQQQLEGVYEPRCTGSKSRSRQ
jgi:hypothetical protein